MNVLIQSKNGLIEKDLNRRRAIREKCLNCSAWVPSEVTKCLFKDCPLWPYRSGLGKQDAKKRSIAIRKYCLWCMGGQGYELAKCVSRNCSLFPYRNTKLDKSTNVDSLAEIAHIEGAVTNKKENEYLGMGG